MTGAMRHRGPDDEGYAAFDGDGVVHRFGGADTPASVRDGDAGLRPVETGRDTLSFLAFGHRRLSIIDLSAAGHQPMAYGEGRYWIVSNGEIYNYLELREELGGLGYRFATGTDTEVIMAAHDR
jgi:asparagine synthase (glutamine-hydrolysing)